MDSLIIAFGYKARHGKDTAVKTIIEARGNEFDVRRYAFADELKREYTNAVEALMRDKGLSAQDAVRELCMDAGVEYEPNPDMTDPLCPYGKPRKLLQWWGTEYRRAQDPYYWVKKLRDRLRLEKPQIALISDLRFKNEKDWVLAESGFTVSVNRHGFDDGSTNPTHISENELDGQKFDYEIHVPDGNLDELKKDALFVFDHIINSFSAENVVADAMSNEEIRLNTWFKRFDKDGKEIPTGL